MINYADKLSSLSALRALPSQYTEWFITSAISSFLMDQKFKKKIKDNLL